MRNLARRLIWFRLNRLPESSDVEWLFEQHLPPGFIHLRFRRTGSFRPGKRSLPGLKNALLRRLGSAGMRGASTSPAGTGARTRGGRRSTRCRLRRNARLGIVSVYHRFRDVSGGTGPKHGRVLLIAGIKHKRELVLLGVRVQDYVNLLRQCLIHIAHRAAGFILSVFRGALQRLCLFVDGLQAHVALLLTQVGAGVLQLLLERINLIALGL